jgi:hypothetical protein
MNLHKLFLSIIVPSGWEWLLIGSIAVLIAVRWIRRIGRNVGHRQVSSVSIQPHDQAYRRGLPSRAALLGRWQHGDQTGTLSDAEWQRTSVAFFAEGVCTLVGGTGNIRQFSWL